MPRRSKGLSKGELFGRGVSFLSVVVLFLFSCLEDGFLCWCATVSLKHNRLVGASLFRMGFNLGDDVCTKEASTLGFPRLWVFWFRLVDPRKAWLWDGNHRNRDPGTFNTCAASYSLGASSAFSADKPKAAWPHKREERNYMQYL